jgi:hypothetical protein
MLAIVSRTNSMIRGRLMSLCVIVIPDFYFINL